MENLFEKLKDIGLNSYEAKVYIALLKKYPSTGYEVSQNANIPQSRAYDALKALEKEQIIVQAGEEKPLKYSPINPKELINRYKRKAQATIEYLEKKLPKIKEDFNEPIHYILEYDAVIKKIKEIIKISKKSIYIEIWAEDFKLIEKELKNAYDNGVDIKIVGYDNIKTNFGLLYNHFGGKEIENKIGRMIYLISDSMECIFGKINEKTIWTKNIDIIFLLKEYIVHNMYLLDVGQNFPEQLKYFYGPGFKRLKEKILSYDTRYNIH